MEFSTIIYNSLFPLGLFLSHATVISNWKRRKLSKEKILIEDTLKHLYDCEYKGLRSSLVSLMKSLSVSREKSEKLIHKLEEMDLIIMLDDELHLTHMGKAYALQIIRIHRLWEKYLAERTNIDSTLWHSRADHLEHGISEIEADKLAAGMSNPVYDPHGDPIPTRDGILPEMEGKLITSLNEGDTGIINHIEDEPVNLYSQIAAHSLYPGQKIKLVRKSNDSIQFTADGQEYTLQCEAAANIYVVEAPEHINYSDDYETLASLDSGETGEVIKIAPSCRGMQRRRLMDLGIIPGCQIKAELKSVGGDPVAYNIRGALIALRRENAKQVYIKRILEVDQNGN